MTSARTPASNHEENDLEEEEEEDEEMHGKMGIMRVPIIGVGGPGMAGMVGGGHNGSPEPLGINDDWVKYFSRIINTVSPDKEAPSTKKRIILLESSTAMSGTFDSWFPSLVEAVKQRRRAAMPQPTSKSKSVVARTKEMGAELQPTTIVLSCTPSLLVPHTGETIGSPVSASGSPTEADSPMSSIRSAVEALAEKFGAMGMGVSVEGPKEGDDQAKLWWSSQEDDEGGRLQRERRRLNALLQQGKA